MDILVKFRNMMFVVPGVEDRLPLRKVSILLCSSLRIDQVDSIVLIFLLGTLSSHNTTLVVQVTHEFVRYCTQLGWGSPTASTGLYL